MNVSYPISGSISEVESAVKTLLLRGFPEKDEGDEGVVVLCPEERESAMPGKFLPTFSEEVDTFQVFVRVLDMCRSAAGVFGEAWQPHLQAIVEVVSEGCKRGRVADYTVGMDLGVLVEMKWLCGQRTARSEALVCGLRHLGARPVYGRRFNASVLSVFAAIYMVCTWGKEAECAVSDLVAVADGLLWLAAGEVVDSGAFGNVAITQTPGASMACSLYTAAHCTPVTWNDKDGVAYSGVDLWATLASHPLFFNLRERQWYNYTTEDKAVCRQVCVKANDYFTDLEQKLKAKGKMVGPFGNNVWAFARDLFTRVMASGL